MKKITKFLNNFGGNIKSGFFRAKKFIVSAFGELRSVEWLSLNETLKYSGYVILFIVLTVGIITLLDLIFYRGLILVIN